MLVAHVAGPAGRGGARRRPRDAWVEEFNQLIGEVQQCEDARAMLQEVKDRGFRLVLASSGKAKHVDAFLDLLGSKSVVDAWTTSEDNPDQPHRRQQPRGTEHLGGGSPR